MGNRSRGSRSHRVKIGLEDLPLEVQAVNNNPGRE